MTSFLRRCVLGLLVSTVACGSPSGESHTNLDAVANDGSTDGRPGDGDTGDLRWFPGNYYRPRSIPLADVDAAITGYLNSPTLTDRYVGIQVTYHWSDLEPGTPGSSLLVAQVRQHLDRVQAAGKKLIVQLQYVTFEDAFHAVPYDMWHDANPIYRGGASGPYGEFTVGTTLNGNTKRLAMLWVPAVRSRFVTFLSALANEIGDHPALAGIVYDETACENCADGTAGYTQTSYLNALKSDLTDTRAQFPRSVIVQYMNFLPGGPLNQTTLLRQLADHALTVRAGIGGPDIRVYSDRGTDPTKPFDPPALTTIRAYVGRVPINMAVEHLDYQDPERFATTWPLATGDLGCNFIAWTDDSSNPQFSLGTATTALAGVTFPNTAPPSWVAP